MKKPTSQTKRRQQRRANRDAEISEMRQIRERIFGKVSIIAYDLEAYSSCRWKRLKSLVNCRFLQRHSKDYYPVTL